MRGGPGLRLVSRGNHVRGAAHPLKGLCSGLGRAQVGEGRVQLSLPLQSHGLLPPQKIQVSGRAAPTSCSSPEALHPLPGTALTHLDGPLPPQPCWHPISFLTTWDTKARWFTHTRVNPGHARAARRLTCTHAHARTRCRTRTCRNPRKGPRRAGGAGSAWSHPPARPPPPPPTPAHLPPCAGQVAWLPRLGWGAGKTPGRGALAPARCWAEPPPRLS